ncbi:MAG: c-type cytochrome, partial [Halioglobus sp.]|nr:c-type cytochrome [Halioglobus sp.]
LSLSLTAGFFSAVPAAFGPMAANPGAGKRLFTERCSLCHSTDSRAGTGPGLGGIMGRPAASSQFAFTDELRNAGLSWDSATLDRYLANPGKVVPGTAMAVTTPVAAERRDIIAYLATLPKGSASSEDDSSQANAATGPGDWNNAVPGRRYHITMADLAKPFATPSVRN